MNSKGAVNWGLLVLVPGIIIMLIVTFPVIDLLIQMFFETVDDTNSLLFKNLLKLLVGSFGFILILKVLHMIVTGLTENEQGG